MPLYFRTIKASCNDDLLFPIKNPTAKAFKHINQAARTLAYVSDGISPALSFHDRSAQTLGFQQELNWIMPNVVVDKVLAAKLGKVHSQWFSVTTKSRIILNIIEDLAARMIAYNYSAGWEDGNSHEICYLVHIPIGSWSDPVTGQR